MKLSVFTPVHPASLPYVAEALASLRAQTFTEWQWVVVPNGGVTVDAVRAVLGDEPRLKVEPYPATNKPLTVGELKRFACSQCSGDVLVELDADDLLTPDALQMIWRAFDNNRDLAFVYSNDAQFDGGWKSQTFSEQYGWQYRPFEYEGHQLNEAVSWPPAPQSIRRIYWAPDHVRAWKATAYRAIGGHNPQLRFADDHDLVCRTFVAYGERGMARIDQCLYLYREHKEQTVVTQNAEIQKWANATYKAHVLPMAIRWAGDNGLRVVELGGRMNAAEGFETVDLFGADITADLNGRWPFEDGSVGVIRAMHTFEHLRDSVHTMNELYRVLAPGGFAFVEVPSTDGRGAFQDPTHVSFWNENSFWYYTQREKAAFIPAFTGRFQAALVETYFPDKWWRDNNIPVVRADLIALKPGYGRPAGEVLI